MNDFSRLFVGDCPPKLSDTSDYDPRSPDRPSLNGASIMLEGLKPLRRRRILVSLQPPDALIQVRRIAAHPVCVRIRRHNAPVFFTSDPDKVDDRTRSKWSRALRYAASMQGFG